VIVAVSLQTINLSRTLAAGLFGCLLDGLKTGRTLHGGDRPLISKFRRHERSTRQHFARTPIRSTIAT
jgi:hypothetical protein